VPVHVRAYKHGFGRVCACVCAWGGGARVCARHHYLRGSIMRRALSAEHPETKHPRRPPGAAHRLNSQHSRPTHAARAGPPACMRVHTATGRFSWGGAPVMLKAGPPLRNCVCWCSPGPGAWSWYRSLQRCMHLWRGRVSYGCTRTRNCAVSCVRRTRWCVRLVGVSVGNWCWAGLAGEHQGWRAAAASHEMGRASA
jgi:hypothetical protein